MATYKTLTNHLRATCSPPGQIRAFEQFESYVRTTCRLLTGLPWAFESLTGHLRAAYGPACHLSHSDTYGPTDENVLDAWPEFSRDLSRKHAYEGLPSFSLALTHTSTSRATNELLPNPRKSFALARKELNRVETM